MTKEPSIVARLAVAPRRSVVRRGPVIVAPRWLVLSLLAWFCLGASCLAQDLTFPDLTGRVVDEAGLLSADQIATLTKASDDLEAKTTDQLVVATLKSLRGTTIEDYGYQLGRHWAIGQKDKNNGVLLIVAPAEHKVRIEVGYGLEGTLTDAATKTVIETTILPRFKRGDFAGGIQNGADTIIAMLTPGDGTAPATAVGQSAAAPGAADSGGNLAGSIIGGSIVALLALYVVGVIVAFVFSIKHGLFRRRRGGGGGGSSGGSGVVYSSSSSDSSSSFSGGGGDFGGGGSSGDW